MLWSEQEATVKQVTQIGTSACGATAAINALVFIYIIYIYSSSAYLFSTQFLAYIDKYIIIHKSCKRKHYRVCILSVSILFLPIQCVRGFRARSVAKLL